MKPKNLFINFLFLLLGIGATYFFYVKNKVDVLDKDLMLTRDELKACENDQKILKSTNTTLQYDVKEAQMETNFKVKEIEALNSRLTEKDNEINDLDIEIQRKEQQVQDMFQQMTEMAMEGATEEVREKIQTLNTEMNDLRDKNRVLQNQRREMQQAMGILRSQLSAKEQELAQLLEIEIPKRDTKIEELKSELEISQKFQAFANIRAEIENIKIDNKKNILQFDLRFDSEETHYLKNNELLKKLTFSPKIFNKTKENFFTPDIKNFSIFTKERYELADLITITFPVSNFSFSKYKNGSKGVNLTKGDEIKIKVVLEELQELEIANKTFYLK